MCLFSEDKDLDHYIVKVYRRDHDDPKKIVGQILHVSTESQRSFTHLEELNEILSHSGNICNGKEKIEVNKRRRKSRKIS